MTHSANILGRAAALRTLGLHKHANDLVAQLAAAEAGKAIPPVPAAPSASGGGKFFSKLRNAKVPLKAELGLGALTGAGLLAHEMGKQPQMSVTPSAPIAPLFP